MTRLKNITISFVFFFTLLSANSFAQDLLQNDKFSYAPLFENEVVLMKEIPLSNPDSIKNFHIVKEWGKERYASDPLISDIRYDNTNLEIIIKSKIELLLPENKNQIREKAVMTYHLNAFILNGKCVFEVTSITYKMNNVKNSLKAENTITQSAIAAEGPQQERRINIQKSTFYFFNELAESLQAALKTGI